MKTCPSCHESYPDDAESCPRDGTRLAAEVREERECPYCAEKILKKAKVCKHCGREVEPLTGGGIAAQNPSPATPGRSVETPTAQAQVDKSEAAKADTPADGDQASMASNSIACSAERVLEPPTALSGGSDFRKSWLKMIVGIAIALPGLMGLLGVDVLSWLFPSLLRCESYDLYGDPCYPKLVLAINMGLLVIGLGLLAIGVVVWHKGRKPAARPSKGYSGRTAQAPPATPPQRIAEPPTAQPQGSRPTAAAGRLSGPTKSPWLRTAPEPPGKMKFVVIAGVALILIVCGVWYFSQHGPAAEKKAEADRSADMQRQQDEQETLTPEQGEPIEYSLFYAKAKSTGLPIGKRFRFTAMVTHELMLYLNSKDKFGIPSLADPLGGQAAFDDDAQHEQFLQGPGLQTRTIVASMGYSGHIQIHRIEIPAPTPQSPIESGTDSAGLRKDVEAANRVDYFDYHDKSPQHLFARRLAENGALAVGSLREIDTAEITYSSKYDRGFSVTLQVLGPRKGPNPTASAADLLEEALASGTKAGYRFTYIAGPVDSTGRINTYMVRADPMVPRLTGYQHFFTDQSGVIRMEWEQEANQNSPPIAG